MSDKIPTITVEIDKGPVVINADDYNPEIHKLYIPDESKADAFDRDAAMEYLQSKGVQFAKNISAVKLEALVAETKAADIADEAMTESTEKAE